MTAASGAPSVRELADAGKIEVVEDFAEWGIAAFTTTRASGSFGTATEEPVRDVLGRWDALRAALAPMTARLATARQVHGAHIIEHDGSWSGWLRGEAGDGHAALQRGTAFAVTIADCVPVFVAHPSGASALLHSGWRGTASGIVREAILLLGRHDLPAHELRIHLGPAICGDCYEVSADVYERVTGRSVSAPTTVDLRAVIADHARAMGVRNVTTSSWCTRHDNIRFFSHRAGDGGRQLGVMIAAL
jgi:copper oxidase (laccase) domain-containing protein